MRGRPRERERSSTERIRETSQRSPEPARRSHPDEKGLVILPTFNERENLPRVVPEILEQDARLETLIVDDNSPDGTGEVADELARSESRVHVMHRAGKLGLGRAYIAGFRWALERDYEYVFEMDADLSHDPRHLPEFLEAIRGQDLVLGSRYLRGVTVVNWPMSRLLLSWSANRYARWVTGLPLTDLTSGFKCFRRRVLQAIELEKVHSEGYSFQIEMTTRAWARGFRILEIPIVFVDRMRGESKMNRRIVWEAVWMVWKLRAWRVLGRL